MFDYRTCFGTSCALGYHIYRFTDEASSCQGTHPKQPHPSGPVWPHHTFFASVVEQLLEHHLKLPDPFFFLTLIFIYLQQPLKYASSCRIL